MRKHIRGSCLLLALVLLTGCGAVSTPPAGSGETDGFISDTAKGGQEDDTTAETEYVLETWYEHPTEGNEKLNSEKLGYAVNYVPIGERVFVDPSLLPEKDMICSAEELKEFSERWDEFYDLDRGTMYPHMAGFREITETYDAVFWEEHDVIILGSRLCSGSIRHNVRAINKEGENDDWVIEVECLIPYEMNEMLQTWLIVIEVPKGKIKGEEQFTVQWHEVRTEDEKSENAEEIKIPLNAQYIRTGELASYEGEPKRTFRVVRSADELNAYYEEFKDIYYLGRNQDVYMDTTIGFLDACDRFDEAFWEGYDLVLLTAGAPSGSIRHEVINMVSTDGGNEWVINAREYCPSIYTCDIAFWYFLIEVPKGMIEETDTVKCSMTSDHGRAEISSVQYVRTDNGSVELGEPEVVVLRSQEELDSYYQENKDQYALLWKDSYKGDSTNGFLNICAWNYPAHFWEWNDLVMIVLQEPNKWIRHEVEEIVFSEGIPQKYTITISKRTYRETDEPANWHILVAVPKGQVWGEEYVKLNWIEVCTEEE